MSGMEAAAFTGTLTWSQPWWLLLLPLPWWLYRHARRRAQRELRALAAPVLWPLLVHSAAGRVQARISAGLFAAAWVLALVAASGPQLSSGSDPAQAAPGLAVDVALVVDVSPSMAARDLPPSRLQRAKFELRDFITDARGLRLSLVAFSAQAYRLLPLTGDLDTVAYFVDALDSGLTRRHGSNLTMALELAARTLERSPPDSRAILVLSDGEAMDPAAVRAAGERLGRRGIPVLALGIGTRAGAPVRDPLGRFLSREKGPVISRLDADLLEALARASGGRYVSLADDDRDWDAVWEALAALRPALRPGTGPLPQDQPLYAYFLVPALILFLLHLLVPMLIPKRTADRMPGSSSRVTAGPSPAQGRGLPRAAVTASALACAALLLPASLTAQAPLPVASEEALPLPSRKAPPFPLQSFHAYLGERALRRGDALGAARHYARAGGYAGALGLGTAAYRLGHLARAREAFAAALEWAVDDAQRARAAYDLGTTLLRAGEWGAAREALEAALRWQPQHKGAWRNLQLLSELRLGGDPQEGEDAESPEDQGTLPGGADTNATGSGGQRGRPASPLWPGRGRQSMPAAAGDAGPLLLRLRMEAQEAALEALPVERPW